jgi:hypothetical protein
MADETKPQDPRKTTSANPQNPITELPRDGGVLATPTGGIAAPTSGIVADASPPGPTGGVTLGVGEDVAKKLADNKGVFGDVLRDIGFSVAESQKALDQSVISGIKKLNDTKIKVVTQVVQELNDDGIPDASKTKLITNELSALNFFTPNFLEYKEVLLSMDLTVGEFHGEQGVKFHNEQESTSVGGGGTWGFGGWFNLSHSRSEQNVAINNSQDVSWSSGQVHVSATLGERTTGKFPTPATVEIGPQIFVTQGAVAEQKTGEVVTSRSVDVMIEVRKVDGSPMQQGVNIVVETAGLLPSFTDGSATNAQGRVNLKLTRSLAGSAKGFTKFPLSAALGAKRKAFTVTL